MTYLLDTNVLLYAHDPRTPDKRERAKELSAHLARRQIAAVPAQALGEFARVALGKFRLSHPEVAQQVETYAQVFPVLPLSAEVVQEAIRGTGVHKMAYYDAQIWAAAKLNGIPNVLSEDFNSGSTVEGVLFLNPFAPEFDLGEL